MSTKDRMRSNGNAGEKNAAAAAAGTRLDPWYNTYADRALGMKQSEVRSLFAVANRPEVVSLAGGMPNIAGLPLDFLADMTARLIRDRGTKILQYGGGQGEGFELHACLRWYGCVAAGMPPTSCGAFVDPSVTQAEG